MNDSLQRSRANPATRLQPPTARDAGRTSFAPPRTFRSQVSWAVLMAVLAIGIILAWLPTQVCIAQDVITLKPNNKGEVRIIEAKVIDWTRQTIFYQANGRQSELPAGRVKQVDYHRNENETLGDRLFEEGKLPQAALAFEHATENVKREWLRRNLLAKRLRCFLATNQIESAIDQFLLIESSESDTRFFSLIPLTWQRVELAASTKEQLLRWLEQEDEIRSLIAASWLLSSHPNESLERLRDLSLSSRAPIAHLATTQQWRTQWFDAKPAGLARWQTSFARMPNDLRAGPALILAQGVQRQAEQTEPPNRYSIQNDALVALLRIPILYPEQYQLSGEALFQANKLLQEQGRPADAERVLRELNDRFRFSLAAGQANEKVEFLDER